MLLLQSSVAVAFLIITGRYVRAEGIWVASAWSACTVTCGEALSGTRTRTWTCEGSENCVGHPQTGGTLEYAPGSTITETQQCPAAQEPCPVGVWVAGVWTPCSVECGERHSGFRERIWTCEGQNNCVGHPQNGGNQQYVPGAAETEREDCPSLFQECPGMWGPWGEWECSVTCGPRHSGIEERERECSPEGSETEGEPCNLNPGVAPAGIKLIEQRPCPEEDIPCPTPDSLDVQFDFETYFRDYHNAAGGNAE